MRPLALLLTMLAAGCSLEGYAYDRDDPQRRFADMDVMLIEDTPEMRRAVAQACSAAVRTRDSLRVERERLAKLGNQLLWDAGALAKRGRANTSEWHRIHNRGQMYTDSAMAIPYDGGIADPPNSAWMSHAVRIVRTDIEGRYEFPRASLRSFYVVPTGSYDAFRFAPWHHVKVGVFGGKRDLTGSDGTTPCGAAGVDTYQF